MALKTVVVDAGHGGTSMGTHSYGTEYEKDCTLELALAVEKRLLHNDFNVVMTRRTDVYVGNADVRAKAIVEAKPDYAISIHFNGFNDMTANGAEIFVPFGEKFGNIEFEIMTGLRQFFKLRSPTYRSTPTYNNNEVHDKKLNPNTKRFEYVNTNLKDYFGIIRNSWSKGVSTDLLEVCFLTNPLDYTTYMDNFEEIADVIAGGIVKGFGYAYKSLPDEEPPVVKPCPKCAELQRTIDIMTEKLALIEKTAKV